MALDGWLSGPPAPFSREAARERRAKEAVERSRDEDRARLQLQLNIEMLRWGERYAADQWDQAKADSLARQAQREAEQRAYDRARTARSQGLDSLWAWADAQNPDGTTSVGKVVRKQQRAEPAPVEEYRRAPASLGEDV